MWRKLGLRRRLLRYAVDGAAYVPFVGDGDIADVLYRERKIYGADIDPARVQTARDRLVGADIRQADCNGWPFPDVDEPFAIADLDAYANPYPPLRSFWGNAMKASVVVIFGTDGQRQNIKRHKLERILPDDFVSDVEPRVWRSQYNFWWARYVRPWVEQEISPSVIRMHSLYLRKDMLYWGAVIDVRP